jgi:Flp pilus assembly protein TadG
MPFSIAGFSRAPKSGRRGSVAIQIGILMTILIGMAGLGTEIPYLMFKQRQMQTAADSAALSAGVALTQGYPDVVTEAKGVAAALGFAKGIGNTTVIVYPPPGAAPTAPIQAPSR